MIEYRAASIGPAALQALSEDCEALVMGTTSHGVFIRANSRVIFISFEAYRGPLTITLNGPTDRLRSVTTGSTAIISSGRLILPSADTLISVERGELWRPANAGHPARPPAERLDSLRAIAKEVLARRGDVGFGALLLPVLGLPDAGRAVSLMIGTSRKATSTLSGGSQAFREPQSKGAILQEIRPQVASFDCMARNMPLRSGCFRDVRMLSTILELREALRTDLSCAAEIACGLLGIGQGLTPSGDDVVVGLLLMLNRWQAALWPDGDLDSLNRRVVESAYTRTTLLSANLIECAALGQADERLINVVDCIVTGHPSESECVPHVLGWGASSGIDALVGMALAVTC